MTKIVYSYYCIDILHIGHILMMKKSKEVAGENGVLVAGILTDKAIIEKKNKPILPFEERIEIAKSIIFLDRVIPQDTYSPLPNIKKIRPHVLMESTSHLGEDIADLQLYMNQINGKIIKIPYYEKQSSSKIKKRIADKAR